MIVIDVPVADFRRTAKTTPTGLLRQHAFTNGGYVVHGRPAEPDDPPGRADIAVTLETVSVHFTQPTRIPDAARTTLDGAGLASRLTDLSPPHRLVATAAAAASTLVADRRSAVGAGATLVHIASAYPGGGHAPGLFTQVREHFHSAMWV